MAVKYGSLPFDAQIAFFKKKQALPTRAWTDIWQANHDHAFVVAGASKMALVEDLQADVLKAIEKGTTLHQFRKDFDATVAKHGWTGWTGEGSKAGRAWRTKIIYQTNMNTSYAAGRFEQLQKFDYWQYHHSIASEDPRPEHVDWNTLVLLKTDPFWQTHYPPNGWGCKCSVTGLSKQRMKAKGLEPSQSPKIEMESRKVGAKGVIDVPKGVDPGFDYAPGRSSWMRAHVPTPLGEPPHGFAQLIPAKAARDLMPEPRPFPQAKLLKDGLEDEVYVKAFLKEFGADMTKPALFTDVAGEPLVIASDLFRDVKGKLKVKKRGRAPFMSMLAEAIKAPDEIWVGMEWHRALGKATVRRRYIAHFELPDGSRDGFAVFEHGHDGWSGVTTYAREFASMDEFDAEIGKMRKGIRLFRRNK